MPYAELASRYQVGSTVVPNPVFTYILMYVHTYSFILSLCTGFGRRQWRVARIHSRTGYYHTAVGLYERRFEAILTSSKKKKVSSQSAQQASNKRLGRRARPAEVFNCRCHCHRHRHRRCHQHVGSACFSWPRRSAALSVPRGNPHRQFFACHGFQSVGAISHGKSRRPCQRPSNCQRTAKRRFIRSL